MSKTMKKVSALLLAILMVVTYMPMMQETAYAAKKAKKPAKVKISSAKASGKKITVKWKKAKNAKKYIVSVKDMSTKLTSSKSVGKKKSFSFTGSWNNKYQIKVRGVNGKKKGSWSKAKTVKIGQDPAITAALEKAAEDAAAKEKLEKDIAAMQQTLDNYKAATAAGDVAIDEAKALIAAYDELKEDNPEAVAALGPEFAQQIEDLRDAVADAEQASQDAKDAEDEETKKELDNATKLNLNTWNPEVKDALNSMIAANAGKEDKYVVFDFDNTCSIFDVEEQLAIYQLQTMSFDETVDADKLEEMLKTELNPKYFTEPAPASADYCENDDATYQDWIDDITAAFTKLDAQYDFTPAGLTEEEQAAIQATDDWKEFATKMRAMYDCVFDSESASVAYPWVLYWFTGMTEDEVYELAKKSHSFYKEEESEYVTWTTAGTDSKIGSVSYEFTWGTAVSDNIRELMAALNNNGIDVWVCSASATDPIRAAIDVWGLHDHVTGLLAMTNKLEGGIYVNEYDYDTGYCWYPKADGAWEKGDVATQAQTQGKGKVTAIQNVCGSEYGCGPIAGFMDSTGDYNFCTEFEDLEVVCCFNRASRKVTDGGGVIAEVAVYEADTLGYDYEKAQEAGDTLYVLQGREENGLRGLRPERATMRLGKTETILFRNDDNFTQLQYMIDNEMKVGDIIDQFAIKRGVGEAGNPFNFKIGFLTEYSGYHSQGASDQGLLKHKDWNPEVKRALNDFIKANANNGRYVVFDFDNTCSIFDVEEQLAIFQLQTMAFDETVDAEKLEEMLKTELNPDYFDDPAPASGDYCENADATYQDWIDDIVAAFEELDEDYDFTPAGLSTAQQAAIQQTDAWKEFATKMRAMYDCVFDSESADVAYPWVLYWFTGMTETEVYSLAKRSHEFYKEEESEYVTWSTPGTDSKIGAVDYEFTWGTAVSDNIVELWKALDDNGIDVWVCSASATDPIRAAIDVWGGHKYITGLLAMTNKLEDDKYVNEYDYDTGYCWYPQGDTGWEKGNVATKAQTQGKGKVTAIQNVCGTEYGEGPIAGFMDSTGDYNFCTEFDTLQLVTCFNRASRKVTDGGGVIAELAVYQADTLGYDFEKAQEAGDTLYVLQGREENGLRGFRPERKTLRLGKTETLLFRNDDNFTQLQYMIDNKMKTQDIVDRFAMKRAVGDPNNPFNFKIGFLTEFSGYHSQGADSSLKLLTHKDWNPEVRQALNDMIKANANQDKYVVFDFDNTCSIFDVEEQLAIYQLQTMAFDETVDATKLEEILKTELNPEYFTEPAPASGDYCGNANATYQDWIDDITAAFAILDDQYDFTPAGLTPEQQAEIQDNKYWKEFATKMRAMYDCVFDSESAAVAYPWVLYWFTGMTEKEVYELAYRSHDFYRKQESKYVEWESPIDIAETAKTNMVTYEWTYGTQVSENIVELWKTLYENGIDVWICSASATDPIRAAIDVWGGHKYIKGMMAMTNKLQDGKYINAYDWEGGNAWLTTGDEAGEENWVKDTELQKTQTQGKGKVIAIQNVLYPKYGNQGPIAGFMDSTGDYNFCTEFKTLQLVVCFNRASRKVTDGGGVIAELAVYQADDLGYDFEKAQEAGDTLYVLQGREENGLRGFRPERATMRLGKTSTILFRNEDNFAQLDKMRDLEMDTETIVNDFAIKTAADDPKYGFSFKYGFVTGEPGEGLGPKFVDPNYNPEPGVDFSGYHSQD